MERLLVEVHRLEVDADWTDPVARARLWKEIAGMASAAGNAGQAKDALGRALDAYIEGGCYDAAVALCRRFLEQYPTVVRAHCTLALLYIARRDLGDAVTAIEAYARAARRSGTESVAIARLMLVANLAVDEDVRAAAVQAMQDLASPGVWRTLLRYLSSRGGSGLLEAEGLMNPLDVALLNQMQVRTRMIEIGTAPPDHPATAAGVDGATRRRLDLPLLDAGG